MNKDILDLEWLKLLFMLTLMIVVTIPMYILTVKLIVNDR